MKRVFLIVLDSLGVGEMPDAAEYGDEGSNTLLAVSKSKLFKAPTLTRLGLFNLDGGKDMSRALSPEGAYGRMREASKGKDTTIGHWEIAGLVSSKPLPTYPDGFPAQIIDEFEKSTGRKVLCNKPYSGTKVIKDYGEQSMADGSLIVYTSADSVFQIAANESVVPVEQLYSYCRMAREILTGVHGVGRVIARPFVGDCAENFTRTANRHDFSLTPPSDTLLDVLSFAGKNVIGVGKINDIFAGKGLTEFVRTSGNTDGMAKTTQYLRRTDWEGLCFVNLVDFDMLYGHRNDTDGYAGAISVFDAWFADFLTELRSEDMVILTSDHGCDPSTPSTDHSREYTFMIACGEKIKAGANIGTRSSFSDISATVLSALGVDNPLYGESFYNEIIV